MSTYTSMLIGFDDFLLARRKLQLNIISGLYGFYYNLSTDFFYHNLSDIFLKQLTCALEVHKQFHVDRQHPIQ